MLIFCQQTGLFTWIVFCLGGLKLWSLAAGRGRKSVDLFSYWNPLCEQFIRAVPEPVGAFCIDNATNTMSETDCIFSLSEKFCQQPMLMWKLSWLFLSCTVVSLLLLWLLAVTVEECCCVTVTTHSGTELRWNKGLSMSMTALRGFYSCLHLKRIALNCVWQIFVGSSLLHACLCWVYLFSCLIKLVGSSDYIRIQIDLKPVWLCFIYDNWGKLLFELAQMWPFVHYMMGGYCKKDETQKSLF